MIKNIHPLNYEALTGLIIGAAMKVHSAIGNGFPEVIYKRCFLIELRENNISYTTEVEKDIFYKGINVGKRRLDIIVEDKILIELKAISEVSNTEFNQVVNYLHIFKTEVGLLLNFGASSLQFRRFVNSNL